MKKAFWIIPVIFVAMVIALWLYYSPSGAPIVVVYVSHDQVFSEPILRDFEKETGIRVRAVYDTEETKSAGAMNRLIAEKHNPQADVYWANEPIRAEVLRQQGVAASYVSPNAMGIPETFRDPNGYWTGFAARARVLIVHRDATPKPTSMLSYTDTLNIQIRKEILRLHAKLGFTLVYVTHNRDEANELGTRTIHLRNPIQEKETL
jgi:iron(III) transport system substrate-binding protein